MSIISLLVLLVVLGFVLYLVNTYIPLAPPIKMLINVIVVVCICLWLLNTFTGIGNFRIGHH